MLLGSSFRSPSYPPSMGMDSIAGGRRPRGLLGSSAIVATPEQEEESRRVAAMLGMQGPDDMPQQQQPQQQPSMGQPQQQQTGTTLGELVGAEPERPKGYWQGGGKFGVKDGLATALAVLGDAFAQQGGGRGGAVEMLTGGRANGADAYKAKLSEYNRNRQIAGLPNMSPREFAAFSMDPKAWGSNNSNALSSHYSAANVNPGEQRVFGNPALGGSVYQAPTAGEQYAGALGEVAQTPGFRTALKDYVLRGSGPTAFEYDTQLDDHQLDNDMSLEGLRQRNRVGMEGVRQGNRVNMEGVRQGNRADLRSAPSYRDMNPPAPRPRAAAAPRKSATRTATNPETGEKMQLVNNQWVPVR